MAQTLTEDRFSTAVYKKSRRAYCIECAFEYFVSLLVTDAFLAKVLSNLGFTDGVVGVISSLISLAFLFQLFTVFAAGRIRNVKRVSTFFHTLSQLFFMSLYLVPFLPFAAPFRRVLAVFCILAAYFGNYFVTTLIYRWGNSFVHPRKRAGYSAVKEMISLAFGMAVSFAVGFVMDKFEWVGNLTGGFLFAAICILIFSICDFLCLLSIGKADIETGKKEQSEPVGTVLSKVFGNRDFRHVIYLAVLWDFGRYMTYGFLGTYKIGELFFTVAQVQLMNMLGAALRFLVSRPFGKFSDRYSYARGFELALLVTMVAFGCLVFITPQSRALMIAFTLLYNGAQAGTTANLFNITYTYVDSRYFVQAMAIKNSIAGLCGFLASLIGSAILSAVQRNGNRVFSLPLYGQQFLALLTTLIFLVTLIYTHRVVCRQKVMIQ